MAKNTVTFELGGRVDYKVLKDGITAFYDLIAVLTGKEDVSWLDGVLAISNARS